MPFLEKDRAPSVGANVIVLDIGSGRTKAGAAGLDHPRVIVDSSNIKGVKGVKTSPLQFGLVQNWANFEKLLEETLRSELRVETENTSVLMTVAPLTPAASLWRTTEIMFDKFSCPSISFASQPALALSSQWGRQTGLVLHSGFDYSYAVPVLDGQVYKPGFVWSPFGGRDVTQSFTDLLKQKKINLGGNNYLGRMLAQNIKEELAYVCRDVEEETKLVTSAEARPPHCVPYETMEGRKIEGYEARFLCTELLFDPSKVMEKHRQAMPEVFAAPSTRLIEKGIQHLVAESLKLLPEWSRAEFSSNIFLSGGNLLFRGLSERLEIEIARCGLDHPVSIVDPATIEHRTYPDWAGGSVLASLPTMSNLWISKDEFDEVGSSIVLRKIIL
eukprot:TRINITY_DN11327_c0_g1_i1.p1 TRINITY_DN11327_c0_g1~~TRINITY_DN11327_c0_g1_i1.p1  ORF type:complete len:387 (-),score=41.09 TRINITY_DN11327_c0_g1_i1:2-1162(-)